MQLIYKRAALLLHLAILLYRAEGAKYDVLKEYQGETFFDDWDFYGNADNLMNGDVE